MKGESEKHERSIPAFSYMYSRNLLTYRKLRMVRSDRRLRYLLQILQFILFIYIFILLRITTTCKDHRPGKKDISSRANCNLSSMRMKTGNSK